MKKRLLLMIFLGIAITGTVLTNSPTHGLGNREGHQKDIPVVIKPLRVGNQIVQVEIKCQPVLIPKPDTLERFTCTLTNRTNRSIWAYGVRYSIIFESNGQVNQISRINTVISYIHPDLLEVKKPITPGSFSFITPLGPIVLNNSVIKRLELEAFYIEFDDATTAGIGGKSREMIANVRNGAARYRNSLRQKYVGRGRSVQAILPLLQENAPLGLGKLSFDQKAGAKAYRRFLRKQEKKGGSASVKRVLDN